jgi:hypothetical protein
VAIGGRKEREKRVLLVRKQVFQRKKVFQRKFFKETFSSLLFFLLFLAILLLLYLFRLARRLDEEHRASLWVRKKTFVRLIERNRG